jgi:hypothetical protein
MSGALPIAKLAIHAVSSFGVSKIVHDIIRNNTTIVTPLDQVRVTVGSLVIGSVIAQHASKHVNDRMDAALVWYEGRKADQPELKVVD